MNKFKECNQCPYEFNDKNLEPCNDCVPKKQTNADRIRSMTDEELAEFLYGIDHYVDDSECIVCFSETRLHDGKEDILEWLQSEAE